MIHPVIPSVSAGPHAVMPASPGGEMPAAKKLHWTDPAEWKRTPPASSMRQAQYAAPKVACDTEDAELVVFYFGPGQGGKVDDNLTRWYGQFTQPDGGSTRDQAKIDKRTVNGLNVTTVQVQGTFDGGGMMGQSASGPKPGWALLGAIAETPAGPWFFKMTGPAKTVAAARAPFDALVASFKLQ
jgi:hypothetical protein